MIMIPTSDHESVDGVGVTADSPRCRFAVTNYIDGVGGSLNDGIGYSGSVPN
jgi:hypothetical protein